jgi:hypothetical protein
MKLLPLLMLSLAGCSLYVGSEEDSSRVSAPPDKDVSLDDGGGQDGRSCGDSGACGPVETHVVAVYETHSNHSGGNHPPGAAQVTIERQGKHNLVLSSYEPVNWRVTLAPGASVETVLLIGYHEQTIDLPGVPVWRAQGCGYSYPYNGGGCETDDLFGVIKDRLGVSPRTFHGCYQASSWTLRSDGSASSNCNTGAGYEMYEYQADCDGDGGGDRDPKWEKTDFTTFSPAQCTGDRYVRFDDKYGVFVGAVLCGDSRHYKLYMSDRVTAPFLEIADFAGHGQDHCELVDPQFTIPDEDDITSGGCTDCSVGAVIDINGPPVYARATFGTPFQRGTSGFWADLTNAQYSCGVSIP